MSSQTLSEKPSEVNQDIEIIRKKLKDLERIIHNPKSSAKIVFKAERNTLIYMDMLTNLMKQRKYVLEEIGHTDKNINFLRGDNHGKR